MSTALLEQIAPEVAGDPRIESLMGLFGSLHDAAAWGNAYGLAQAYWVAHMVQIAPYDGGDLEGMGDPATGVTPLSKRVREQASVDAMRMTLYGRMYLHLRDTRSAGIGLQFIGIT